MIMVDELLFSNETSTRCRFTVEAGNIFADAGVLCEPGLVENIAQTAAAGVGYLARQEEKAAPVGYIGAIKDLEIFMLPKVGDCIETEVQLVSRVFNVTLVNGTIYCNNELAVKCEMKIFVTKPS